MVEYFDTWISQDGREQLISEMNEKHIENCINKLKREPLTNKVLFGGGSDVEEYFYEEEEDMDRTNSYIFRFELELLRRQIKAITDKMA